VTEVSYIHATIASEVDSELSREYQPGEPAAFTLARAIAAHLADQMWLRAVELDTNGTVADVSIVLGVAGQRIAGSMLWRAGQFFLYVGGERDSLRHSQLAHRAEYLATLITDTAEATIAELADQKVAERLAGTIRYAGELLAYERAGTDHEHGRYRCAQCGHLDDAAAGLPTQLVGFRCPVCRGEATEHPPTTLPPKPRRRRRRRAPQGELITKADLPDLGRLETRGPLATWPVHRLLQDIANERYTSWKGEVYEVVTVEGRQCARTPDPHTLNLIAQLREARLVHVSYWLFADVDGQQRETNRLAVSKQGWRALRRWALLGAASEPTANHPD
jgi:hypothetical protein